MTPKGHAIPSKTQLLSYGTPALSNGDFYFMKLCVKLAFKIIIFLMTLIYMALFPELL